VLAQWRACDDRVNLEPSVVMGFSLRVVGGFSGEVLCTLKADLAWSGRTVKLQIEKVEGTSRVLQKLLVNGQILEDNKQLRTLLPHGAKSAEVGLVRADKHLADVLRDVEGGKLDLDEIDEELRGHRDIVLAAVQNDGLSLEHATDELKGDRDIVFTAVKECGSALRHALPALQEDKKLVLVAVQKYGQALQYASKSLRGDSEVGLHAALTDPNALRFATEELRSNREFMLQVLSETKSVEPFRHLSDKLRHDKELFLQSVREYPFTFCYAASELQYDRPFILELVHSNGCAVGFASADLKQDPEVREAAMQNNPDAGLWMKLYCSCSS